MYNSEVTKSKVLSSLFWKLMERGGTQGIQFIVQIILARLLMPEDYGIIALVVIFTSIAAVFVQSGLNSALIQKKYADRLDFSSVFYLSLLISVLIYIILYLVAPFVADFYKIPLITPVFRVLSIILFFGAFNSIQNAVIAKKLQFRILFLSSTCGILVSGIIGIFMAYNGFGVWALVGQQLSNQLLVTLVLWFTVKWRPQLLFSIGRLKDLFSYGWKILVSTLINTVYHDLYGLVIGKIFAPTMLGYYNRGQQFPLLIVSNIDGAIQSVMFPVLASYQDNRPRVKEMMRRAIVTSSFIIFPAMVGLAVTAEPLVRLLLTDKWLPCVPFLQIFCIYYAFIPIHSANLQAIKGLGYSDVYLKIEVIKRAIGLTTLIVTVFYGVYAIALGMSLVSIVSSFINAYPNKQLLNYSYKEQWSDIYPSMMLSLIMGAIIYCFKWFGLSVFVTLLIQICIGIILYIGMAWVFKLECFEYLLVTGKSMFKN